MSAALQGNSGFTDPVFDAQDAFRTILDALARPGRVLQLSNHCEAPGEIMQATATIGLCLLDQSTTLWLDPSLRSEPVCAYFRFHTGCMISEDPLAADFAVIPLANSCSTLSKFRIGTPEYPDRSTTIIVEVDDFSERLGVRFSGPGIAAEGKLAVNGDTEAFWHAVRRNHMLFPLGVDFLLVAGNRIVGLPRSTTVKA